MKIKSEERPKNEPQLNCGGHEWRAAPRCPGDDNQSCLGDQPGPNMEAWWFAMVPENRAFKWLRFHLGSECWGSDWCLSGWDTLLLVSCLSKAIRKCPLGPENDSLWWHNIPFPWSNRIRLFWWAEWVMFHSRGFIYTCYFSWESSWNGFFSIAPWTGVFMRTLRPGGSSGGGLSPRPAGWCVWVLMQTHSENAGCFSVEMTALPARRQWWRLNASLSQTYSLDPYPVDLMDLSWLV